MKIGDLVKLDYSRGGGFSWGTSTLEFICYAKIINIFEEYITVLLPKVLIEARELKENNSNLYLSSLYHKIIISKHSCKRCYSS